MLKNQWRLLTTKLNSFSNEKSLWWRLYRNIMGLRKLYGKQKKEWGGIIPSCLMIQVMKFWGQNFYKEGRNVTSLSLKTLNPNSCMTSHQSWSWTIVHACNNIIDFKNLNYVMVSWFSFHELDCNLLHGFQMLFPLSIGVWLWWRYDGIEDLNYFI